MTDPARDALDIEQLVADALKAIPGIDSFLTVSELDASSARLAAAYPDRVKLVHVGESADGYPIKALIIGPTKPGTALPLPDGTIAKVKVDFDTLEKLSRVAREEYGIGGAVQHGASTLPEEAFHLFREKETAEIHLATGFQNMIYDNPAFPQDLKRTIYEHLQKEHADEKKQGETEEQFIYKTRKKAFGPFKKQVWDLPVEVKVKICDKLEKQFDFLFKQLGVPNTQNLVQKYIKPEAAKIPAPAVLAQAAK